VSLAVVAHPDAELRREIRTHLEGDGHRVVEVDDGDTLRQALAADHAEVLVLDVALPGALAIHLIPELRAAPETQALVILLVASIYDSHAWRRPARELHGADALVYPHRLDQTLLPRLRARLEAQGAAPGDPS
jgi:two-component system OmpR family response regulator